MSNFKNVISELNNINETMTEYLRKNFDDIQVIINLYETRNRKQIKELSKKNEIIGETVYETIINLMKKDGITGYAFNVGNVKSAMRNIREEKGLTKSKSNNVKNNSKNHANFVVKTEDSPQQNSQSRSLINEDNKIENVKKSTEVQVSHAPIINDLETFLKEVRITQEEEHKIKVELDYLKTFNSIDMSSEDWDNKADIILEVFQFLSKKTNAKCSIFPNNKYMINDLLLSRLVSYTKSDGQSFYKKCKVNKKDTSWWE